MLKDIKYTGINTASNAYDAPAGQLAVAHNVVNERGYIETLAPPAQVVDYGDYQLSGYKCVFRHDMLSGTSNYIFYKPGTSVGSLQWLSVIPGVHGTEVTWIPGSPVKTSIADEDNLFEITAVGNTLCVLTAAGMDYFVWKNGTYKELGVNLPNVTLQFALEDVPGESGSFTGIIPLSNTLSVSAGAGPKTLSEAQQSWFTDDVMGAVNKFRADNTEKGFIGEPFFVRYAIRLFDGNLVNHSVPILMCPSMPGVTEPYVGIDSSNGDNNYNRIRLYGVHCRLCCKALTSDLGDWGDIIDCVEIYMSKPQSRVAQDKKITTVYANYSASSEESFVTKHEYSVKEYADIHDTVGTFKIINILDLGQTIYRNCASLPTVSETEPELDSIFYKIKTLRIDELPSYASGFNRLKLSKVLSVLDVQEVMTDDYHTHDILVPGGAYAYNERINLYGIERSVIFDQNPASFLEYFDENNDTRNVTAYVRIETPDGDKWIASDATTMIASTIGNIRYFFYPDTHAKEVRLIYNAGSILSPIWIGYTLELKQHPNLNGAYWYSEDASVLGTVTIPTVGEAIFHELNKVYTSEVGNPFYFPIGGINTIGTGKIIALASNVRAISQGQFGEYPLYVFTDSGIWMMEVDDKGLYKAKQPMSLDVIKPGSKVTSVDNAVAYVIERGLMLVSGSETRCISEVLDGKPEGMPDLLGGIISTSMVRWETYKYGVSCAYDEAHQRLHVYNPGYDYHYVYSVRTGLWTTEDDESPLLSTLNGKYVNTALGLLDMSLNDDNGDYRIQTILTRPISFETDAYKRLRDNIQRGDIDLLRVGNTRNISVLVQATDDLIHWHNIAGVTRHYRIVRKSGTPHKWFRWKIVIGSSPEEYRLHGLTADIDVTGNNKLR